MYLHSNQFCIIARKLKLFFQWELFQLCLFHNFKTNWKNNLNFCAIIQNWFECKHTLLYVSHINHMNPYWKWDVWALIICDPLESCIFYMPFCSSLHMTDVVKIFLKCWVTVRHFPLKIYSINQTSKSIKIILYLILLSLFVNFEITFYRINYFY